jgi:pimeloyl-ACP methyl ester carboxylesterase
VKPFRNQPVYLVEAGPAEATVTRPVVVMIHGIGVSNWYFRPMMRELRDEYRTVAIDLPGFGNSPVPGRRFTVADYAAVVNEVIRRQGWVRPVLVGHSMGCQVVSECERQQPGISRGLILMGPTITAGRRSVRQQAARLLLDAWREPLRTTVVVTADYIRTSTRHYIRTIKPMLNDRIEERLPLVEPPVLVIRGSRDPLATSSWSQELAARTADGRMVQIDDGAHNIQHSHPVAVADLCRSFIEDLQ